MEKISVILVDDQQLFRGIQSLLRDEPSIELVGLTSEKQELIRLLTNAPVDLVLLDPYLSSIEGYEIVQYLVTHHPDIRILVWSMVNSEKLITRMLDAGALGYILKTASRDELIYAIQKVSFGQTYIGTEIAMGLLKKTNPKSVRVDIGLDESTVDLSKREVEVLELISDGYNNHEIAEKLCVSKRTIDSHRQNLMDKTRMKNTAALIKFAMTKGIIS